MERILIADYDEENRKELKQIMDGLYEMEFASSGEEAVQIIEANMM